MSFIRVRADFSRVTVALRTIPTKTRLAVRQVVNREAQNLRGIMVRGLRDQAPGGSPIRPLSEMTILLRGLKRGKGGGRRKLGSRQSGPLAPGQKRSFKPRRSRSRSNLAAGASGPLARGQKRSRGQKKARRGGSKALIRSGDLIASIAVENPGNSMAYTVGVHRNAKGKKGGGDMVNLARIHEYGTKKYTITVTQKMMKFSRFLVVMGVLRVPWKVGQVLKKQTPARPFLRPAWNQWSDGAEERISHALSTSLRLLVK